MAATAARGQFGDGSTPKFVHYILVYLCAKIGAFIKKCTIGLNILGKLPHYYCSLDRVNVITGDFNCPKIDWSCLTSPSDGIHELLLDCVIECGLTQIVDFSTRKNNVLDLILIDEVQRILTILERPSLGQSDHCCVEFSVLVDFACDASDYSSYRYYSWRKSRLHWYE